MTALKLALTLMANCKARQLTGEQILGYHRRPDRGASSNQLLGGAAPRVARKRMATTLKQRLYVQRLPYPSIQPLDFAQGREPLERLARHGALRPPRNDNKVGSHAL
jgi:hypothetical protein